MPDPAKIAANLARYIGDLPDELLSTFCAQHLLEASKQYGKNGDDYLSKISSAMQHHPAYRQKVTKIMQAINDYKKKAKLIKGADPAQ
jgi:hypothetical protein